MLPWINVNYSGKCLFRSLQKRVPYISSLNGKLLQELREKCMWVSSSCFYSDSPVLRNTAVCFLPFKNGTYRFHFFRIFLLSGMKKDQKKYCFMRGIRNCFNSGNEMMCIKNEEKDSQWKRLKIHQMISRQDSGGG